MSAIIIIDNKPTEVSDDACKEIMGLRSENAALRADKERLDWLESGCSCDLSWVGKEAPPSALTSLRNAIDWTMKEAQS